MLFRSPASKYPCSANTVQTDWESQSEVKTVSISSASIFITQYPWTISSENGAVRFATSISMRWSWIPFSLKSLRPFQRPQACSFLVRAKRKWSIKRGVMAHRIVNHRKKSRSMPGKRSSLARTLISLMIKRANRIKEFMFCKRLQSTKTLFLNRPWNLFRLLKRSMTFSRNQSLHLNWP